MGVQKGVWIIILVFSPPVLLTFYHFECKLFAALYLSVVLQVIQLSARRCEWEHPTRGRDGEHYYLWICSRASFKKTDFIPDNFVTMKDLVTEHAEIQEEQIEEQSRK